MSHFEVCEKIFVAHAQPDMLYLWGLENCEKYKENKPKLISQLNEFIEKNMTFEFTLSHKDSKFEIGRIETKGDTVNLYWSCIYDMKVKQFDSYIDAINYKFYFNNTFSLWEMLHNDDILIEYWNINDEAMKEYKEYANNNEE